MAKRRTKKQIAEGQWTNVARQILYHSSVLALLSRDCLPESLKQARRRLQEFCDAWLKTGEGDVLPASGETTDEAGCLNDVDVFEAIIDVLNMKIVVADVIKEED